MGVCTDTCVIEFVCIMFECTFVFLLFQAAKELADIPETVRNESISAITGMWGVQRDYFYDHRYVGRAT